MGNENSKKHKSSFDSNLTQHSKNIEKVLKVDSQNLSKEVKVLLLGAGESGKSTIFKQMKILHLNGFSHEEQLKYKCLVFTNTIENHEKAEI